MMARRGSSKGLYFPLLFAYIGGEMASMTLSLSTPISPSIEMGAYEALWLEMGTWFKNLAEKFRAHPGALPSDILANPELAMESSRRARDLFSKAGIDRFGVRINGAGEYPLKLRDADYPIELLYFQGLWDVVETRCVAVVGTRHPTREGILRAQSIVKSLAQDKFTIVSGLASGVDTVAHVSAIENNAPTVAVIGTPLSQCYPKENKQLQEYIANNHLLISQVPVCRYAEQDFRANRFFFPERNITMSALTEATVIVEASDTSGTLIQARGAIKQGRKLFIMESCFNKAELKWPARFEQQGAIRIKDYDDMRVHLFGRPADSKPTTSN
jgi:DNA processing protein